jgi:hypothetical protein
MRRTAVLAWVLSLCPDLRLSQRKTLADLAHACLRTGRVSLAAIGRNIDSPAAAKHRIKRAWRFCANHRIQVADAMAGVVRRLSRRGEPLLVALDWVEVRSFQTPVAAAVAGRRAVPLVWASYPEWVLHKSQNDLGEGLLRLLRSLVPDRVPVILLADRGSGRAEMAVTCRDLGFHYVIRVRPDVTVSHPRFRGNLHDYPVKRGMRRVLRGAAYRSDGRLALDVVIRWKKGLPADRDEPWFLITDLGKRDAVALTDLYGRRVGVEELFRDDKSLRNGFAPRLTKVTRADRFDRLLLILAVAYLLLSGAGLVARARCRPREWCTNTRPDECSAFTIGRVMIDRVRISPAQAFIAVLQASEEPARNWG